MKLVIRIAEPKTQKERLYHVEAEVADLRDPGEAWAVIDGKEYLIDVHFEHSVQPRS
jgi:hypothetical protein